MNSVTPRKDTQLAHGTLFIVLVGCALATPLFRRWPWIWLAPLVAYFAVVLCVPPLRRSMHWFRSGRVSAASAGVTIGIMVLTALTLLAFQAVARPDVRPYQATLPLDALGGAVWAGIIFAFVNATLEEFVFRGVIFEALATGHMP